MNSPTSKLKMHIHEWTGQSAVPVCGEDLKRLAKKAKADTAHMITSEFVLVVKLAPNAELYFVPENDERVQAGCFLSERF